MPITQKVVTLNSFGDGAFERRTRTNSSGVSSDRYTASIDAKPLKLEFDPKALGAGVANTITEHLRSRIEGIAQDAAPSTQLKRKYAGHALANMSSWAMKRYAGGRTGIKPPNQSPRLFNDSGRLVESLISQPTSDGNWMINVAANRLKLESEAATSRMIDRLRQFVPEFGSAARLLGVTEIQVAIRDATRAILGRTPKGQKLRDIVKELTKVAVQTLTKE